MMCGRADVVVDSRFRNAMEMHEIGESTKGWYGDNLTSGRAGCAARRLFTQRHAARAGFLDIDNRVLS